MNNLMVYFIKVSLITAALYGIYWFFLRKTRFHSLNRTVLLFIIPFSIVCPLISLTEPAEVVYHKFNLNAYSEILLAEKQSITQNFQITHFSLYSVLIIIYLIGCIFFLVRFSGDIFKLFRLKKSGESYKVEKFTFIISDNINAPFSFFFWIFLPKFFSETTIYDSIVEHEKVHSRQLHSLDLILSETFCIAFWFNPFVFLLKKSLKTTHEYIADKEVICNGITAENYLLLLISAVEMSCLSGITNQFKSLTIKKRVEMITKNRSSKVAKYNYLLLIPIIAFSIACFSGKSQSPTKTVTNNKTQNVPCIKPIKESDLEKISSGWGMRVHPVYKVEKMHEAVDLVAKEGTPVIATADGKVTQVEFVEEEKGYGRVIVIQHNTEYATLYAQLSVFKVKAGDEVKKGDIIGCVGHSGLSTGPHLHYEVIKNGKRVNPELYW